jgi:MFS transporter, DHA1 family, inner membrane transport protein
VTTTLSPARTRLALLALALGGFGIGATEFVAMGLLPNLAADLLPDVYAASRANAESQAGLLISAYALGVVVGAPTIAAAAAKFARKRLLLVLLGIIVVATLASAALPTFESVLFARFVSGLPHGAYFGIASLVAASLMGPGQRGRGIAFVLSGLTISNVIGVPSITYLGQVTNWRVAYLAVAAIFALTFIAVSFVVPNQGGDPNATMKRELRAFGRSQVWFALAMGAIGFGGFFAVYTYIAPVVTEVTGQAEGFVPVVLVIFGLGMTIGNLLGGRFADHHVMRTLFACFVIFIVSLVGFALSAENLVGLLAFAFLVSASASALSPAIQTRLMDVAGDSQTMAAAVNHSSLNLGNSLGALLGGVVIAAGFGYLSATWIGVALAILGLLIAVGSALLQRVRPIRA